MLAVDFSGAFGSVPHESVHGVNPLMMIVENNVIDNHAGRVQLAGHQLAVGTDAANVACVVDMHRSCARIENLNLLVARGRTGDRLLRTRIVERAEWIGRRINRRRRDVRAIHRVQISHRGAVGPSGNINSTGIDVAGRDFARDEMIDRRCVRIFPPDGVANLHVTRGVQLPIPIVPADAVVVRKWVVVRRLAPLGRQNYVSNIFRVGA